ncbi:hypothetical protein DESUT3_37890 [Desulfuromonas versatilis]|uniref:DUF507 domain-containing protein n=1 Tax=Desulfuromonas versatilis TaxID=2802975 RepID=A0ABM8HWL2_9BACT|nr:DUF507 family protein [Desulfuromonas versatilis]BCR06720.1 hypothetical protein DESUT3_37890 [Desulfuromonas versatilis]
MKLSEQRISHLAHLIADGLWKDDLVDYRDEARALQSVKEALTRVLSVDDQVDGLVREKLQRQKKIPGSREWQVLYDKYFAEEMAKRKW